MYADKRILAVVPARGGSKGLPRKNLRPVLGVPLVARVGDCIGQIPIVDRAVVSTDDLEIAQVAQQSGLDAPFLRPAEISGDHIGDWDVLIHALKSMEDIDGMTYDVIVMLQPTSPLRRPEHVIAAIHKLLDEGWDAVWTLSETDPKNHPLKQFRLLAEDCTMDYYDPRGVEIIARQDLDTLYHRNGVAYAITRDCLVEQKTTLGARTGALVLEGEHVSIDTEWDIQLVEFVMKRERRN